MKLLLIILFISSSILFGQPKDTNFVLDLNFDGNEENISFKYDPDNMQFILSANKSTVNGKFSESYDADVKIIDINRNDGLREILVCGYGSSDQNDMYFFQYINGSLTECGHLPSNFGIEVTGNSEITENAWMGFWTAKLKYKFDTRKKTITKINEEFYEVAQECVTKTSFNLLKNKDDNSEISAVLKPGTKLFIIKADISPVCNYENGEPDNYTCDWYYFKTQDGKYGWCRLKLFQDNVDGLIWAG